MDFSQFYAKLIGLYLIIVAMSMLVNSKRMKAVILDSANNNTFIILTGVLSLLFGLTIVITHNVWVGWPIIITLLGYLSIAKGISRLFFSDWLLKQVITRFVENRLYNIAMLIVLVIGVMLTYCGFGSFKH